MATRTYQSIGEVLVSVKTEFPDITISKIRFLEAEGLIEPERTPSGYRKFYAQDVDRLRGILRMQRDEYLPLRVIKDRLLKETTVDVDAHDGFVEESGSESYAPALDDVAEPTEGLRMSLEEMAAAAGVDKDRVRELESFGILCSHGPADSPHYDGEDYLILSIVKDFFRHGIEARHLTMFKHFVDREAGLFEALVAPTMRQKNPDARRAAAQTLTELSTTSRRFKQALLRQKLRDGLTEVG